MLYFIYKIPKISVLIYILFKLIRVILAIYCNISNIIILYDYYNVKMFFLQSYYQLCFNKLKNYILPTI